MLWTATCLVARQPNGALFNYYKRNINTSDRSCPSA